MKKRITKIIMGSVLALGICVALPPKDVNAEGEAPKEVYDKPIEIDSSTGNINLTTDGKSMTDT